MPTNLRRPRVLRPLRLISLAELGRGPFARHFPSPFPPPRDWLLRHATHAIAMDATLGARASSRPHQPRP